MRQLTSSPDLRFLLLPLPEFAMLPFGGFVDKLRFTADDADFSRQRYCTWEVLGDAHGHVDSSSGIEVQIQVIPDGVNYRDFDYLVIFGGRSAMATEALAQRYNSILRSAARQGVKLVSVDNACFLLAKCGLLAGHKVAIHWRHEVEFRTSYPRIEFAANQMYCFDGNLISCPGGSAAIDLAVEILARSCGRNKALKGLSDMLVDEARSNVHQIKSLDDDYESGHPINRAVAQMRTLLASGETINTLATTVGISRRQLDRIFMDHHGVTAKEYWTEMRLQHAKWRLLNSSHSIAALADEIGIADTSYFGKYFSKRFGMTPASFRRNANQHHGKG